MTYKIYPHFAVIYRIRKPSFITSEGRNLSLMHKIASLRTLKFAGYKKSNTLHHKYKSTAFIKLYSPRERGLTSLRKENLPILTILKAAP